MENENKTAYQNSFLGQSASQLSFELNNPKAPDTIYIGDDSGLNKLTFKITTNTTITLSQSVPVDPSGAASASGSLLYLDLSPLGIDSADFVKITCNAKDWVWKAYNNTTLCFAPSKKIQLGSGTGDAIEIEIDGLIVRNGSMSSENLSVNYYRVAPISSGKLPGIGMFKVLLQNPPVGNTDLHKNITCALSPFNFVTASVPESDPVLNDFSLIFSLGADPLLVKAGPDSKFLVSFVYADAEPGYGALCTPKEAVSIKVKQGVNASSWKISSNTSQENPSWTLIPTDGQPIIGTGVKSVLGINISELVTYFQAGATIMYVQYENIPGYDDGSYSLLINKLPHVVINSLTVNPNPSVLSNGIAEVVINWSVKDAEKLTLMPFYKDVTGKTSVTEFLSESTEITLVATGSGSQANEEIKTIKANVLPVINSFKGSPTNIYAKDYPHDSQFYWDVDTNGGVYLENGSGFKQVVASRSSERKTLYGPNIWSVVPEKEADYYKLKRDLLVRSFDTENKSSSLPFSPSGIAVSPTAPFVAAINSADNKVYILNNLTFDNYINPISSGNKPSDLVFSSDGNFLFVTDELDKNVSVFVVEYDNQTTTYKFELQIVIVLSSSPQRIVVSNDNQYAFITGIDGDNGDLSIIKTSDPEAYQLVNTLPVGKTPQGLAVNPSGAQIYVANMADNSISIIGYSPISDTFQNVRTIANVTGAPSDIALGGPNSTTLLVACKTSNTVMVMDPNDTGSSTRQSLMVGNSPVRLATIPGYAFVTNSGSKSISLLSTYDGIGKCKVLENSIIAGDTPTAISISGSDNMVFVANSKGSSLNVLNLINYEAKGSPIPVGEAPNSTIVSPNGNNIVAWYNVKSLTVKSSYDKGIYIYDTKSSTVNRKMDLDTMIDCIYYPMDAESTAYVSVDTNNYITVLETKHYNSTMQVVIPNGVGDVKRYPENLAITSDGTILSTLVRDSNGGYDLIIFQVDIATKIYTIIADLRIFSSPVISNTILMEMNFNGSSIAVVSAYDQKVWLVNKKDNGDYKMIDSPLELDLIAKSMVINPEGNSLYILSSMNTKTSFSLVNLKAFMVENYPLPDSYEHLVNLQDMVISPDGANLYITDADIAGIRVVSTESLSIIQTLEYTQNVRYPSGIALAPDGLNLYFTGSNSNNLLWISQIGYEKGNDKKDVPNMNFLKSFAEAGPYQGIFIRDYIGETTTDHSAGSWTTSPDIICNGTAPIKNIKDLTDKTNYDKGLPNTNTQTPLAQNNVYIRGINTADAAQDAMVYLYYVDTTMVLWPQNWKSDNIISSSGKSGNGAPFNATTKDEIIVTSPGFLWTPPRQGVHYCLTAYVMNSPDMGPPKLYEVGTVNDMAQWILSRPNVGWRNTIEVDASQASTQDSSKIDGAKYGGLINIGIQLQNLPVGGEFEFSCQGDIPENTIIYPRSPITNPNAAITVLVKWTPGYNSTLVFKYYKMATTPPDGSRIIPIVGTRLAGSDFMSFAKKIAPQHVGLFESYESPQHLLDCLQDSLMDIPVEEIFIVGSVAFELKS